MQAIYLYTCSHGKPKNDLVTLRLLNIEFCDNTTYTARNFEGQKFSWIAQWICNSIDYIYPYPGLCTKCLQSDFCKVSVLNYLAPFLCDPRCDRRLMSEVEGQLGANGGFRVSVQLQN